MKAHTSLLLAIGLVIETGTLARAQTPPTPPAPSTRETPHTADRALPDFSGTWIIDRNYSNDPAQANFGGTQGGSKQSGQSHGGSGGRGGFGGLGGLGGFGHSGGSGGGNSGGRSHNDASGGGVSADDQARLAALTEELKKSAATLTISHHDPSFVVTNGLEHAIFCKTNGERLDQHFGDLTIPTETNWEGDRIVTEFDLSSRRRLMFTYTLLPNTKQLVLRVRLEDEQGSRGNGAELKLVYRMSTSDTK
ncbi:MAG TPA: hypothetical protein VGH34_18300 [Vicinamibacterales bacterium]